MLVYCFRSSGGETVISSIIDLRMCLGRVGMGHVINFFGLGNSRRLGAACHHGDGIFAITIVKIICH